jgi:hypothetical protein
MHISYKIEVKNNDGRIVRVEDFTRFTEITQFHKSDIALANLICIDLTNALRKVGTPCPTTK